MKCVRRVEEEGCKVCEDGRRRVCEVREVSGEEGCKVCEDGRRRVCEVREGSGEEEGCKVCEESVARKVCEM